MYLQGIFDRGWLVQCAKSASMQFIWKATFTLSHTAQVNWGWTMREDLQLSIPFLLQKAQTCHSVKMSFSLLWRMRENLQAKMHEGKVREINLHTLSYSDIKATLRAKISHLTMTRWNVTAFISARKIRNLPRALANITILSGVWGCLNGKLRYAEWPPFRFPARKIIVFPATFRNTWS